MEIAALKKRGSSWRKGCGARLIVFPLLATSLTERMDWVSTGLFGNSENQKRGGNQKKQTNERVGLRNIYYTAYPAVGRGVGAKKPTYTRTGSVCVSRYASSPTLLFLSKGVCTGHFGPAQISALVGQLWGGTGRHCAL